MHVTAYFNNWSVLKKRHLYAIGVGFSWCKVESKTTSKTHPRWIFQLWQLDRCVSFNLSHSTNTLFYWTDVEIRFVLSAQPLTLVGNPWTHSKTHPTSTSGSPQISLNLPTMELAPTVETWRRALGTWLKFRLRIPKKTQGFCLGQHGWRG